MQVSSSDWDKGRRICIEHPDMDMVIIGNFTSAPIAMKPLFPKSGSWNDPFSQWSQSVSDADKQVLSFTLPAHSFRLFTRKSSSTANEGIKTEYPISIHRDNDHVFVQSSQPVERIDIYSITGLKVRIIRNTSEFSLSGLSSGLYFVTVHTNQTTSSIKLQK